MSRKIFGEFREFFPTGLDSFKIQTKLNLVLLPEFVIQILLEIWTYPQKERCSFFIYHLAEFAKKKLEHRMCSVCIFQIGATLNIGKDFNHEFGPNPLEQCSPDT
jgi:hypothetical protein